VLDLRGYAFYQGGVRVVTELEDAPPVSIDENEIQHVLLALVENALQSMARQAGERVLTVRAGHAGGRAFLELLDTGEGIGAVPPERLFEPFFSTRDQPGLGLAVAKAIVQAHGGTLRAAGRPAGGASFTVELPADERPA
jgi:signal transduction histidine kinase